MMPIAGLTPYASWNSAFVASKHASSSTLAGADCAVSALEHTALAIIPAPTIHLDHPRMLASRAGFGRACCLVSPDTPQSVGNSLTLLIVTLSEAKGTMPAHGPLRFAQGDKPRPIYLLPDSS
jgi:hypothetical protein